MQEIQEQFYILIINVIIYYKYKIKSSIECISKYFESSWQESKIKNDSIKKKRRREKDERRVKY